MEFCLLKTLILHKWINKLPWLSMSKQDLTNRGLPLHLSQSAAFSIVALTWLMFTQWLFLHSIFWILHCHLPGQKCFLKNPVFKEKVFVFLSYSLSKFLFHILAREKLLCSKILIFVWSDKIFEILLHAYVLLFASLILLIISGSSVLLLEIVIPRYLNSSTLSKLWTPIVIIWFAWWIICFD